MPTTLLRPIPQARRFAFTAEEADALAAENAAGSMGPKVRAACWFAQLTGGMAAIGSVDDVPALVRGQAGTVIAADQARVAG